jgi:hypothetical protein
MNSESDSLLFPFTPERILDMLAAIPGMLPQSRFDTLFSDPEFVQCGNQLIYQHFLGNQVAAAEKIAVSESLFREGIVRLMDFLIGRFASKGLVLSPGELQEIGTDAAYVMADARLSYLNSFHVNERLSYFGGLLSKLKNPESFEVENRAGAGGRCDQAFIATHPSFRKEFCFASVEFKVQKTSMTKAKEWFQIGGALPAQTLGSMLGCKSRLGISIIPGFFKFFVREDMGVNSEGVKRQLWRTYPSDVQGSLSTVASRADRVEGRDLVPERVAILDSHSRPTLEEIRPEVVNGFASIQDSDVTLNILKIFAHMLRISAKPTTDFQPKKAKLEPKTIPLSSINTSKIDHHEAAERNTTAGTPEESRVVTFDPELEVTVALTRKKLEIPLFGSSNVEGIYHGEDLLDFEASVAKKN